MRLKRLLPILTTTLSLAACATAGSSPPVPEPVRTAAPILKRYPPEFQKRLAVDFARLPQGSAGRQGLKDHGQLRRATCMLDGWRQQACRDIQAADRRAAGAP